MSPWLWIVGCFQEPLPLRPPPRPAEGPPVLVVPPPYVPPTPRDVTLDVLPSEAAGEFVAVTGVFLGFRRQDATNPPTLELDVAAAAGGPARAVCRVDFELQRLVDAQGKGAAITVFGTVSASKVGDAVLLEACAIR